MKNTIEIFNSYIDMSNTFEVPSDNGTITLYRSSQLDIRVKITNFTDNKRMGLKAIPSD